jgi:hypothetical protein
MADVDDFPIARCAPCGRDVLTHVDLDAGGAERRRCVHCDAELDPAEVRWVDADALAHAGYAIGVDGAGCGRPDCGQGRCGRPAGI